MFDFPAQQVPQYAYERVVENSSSWDISISQVAKSHLNSMSDEELDADWKLNDFFESIFVINLPSATVRLQTVTQELQKIGAPSVQVFSAIDGRKELDVSIWKKLFRNLHNKEGQEALDRLHQGQAGCYMSHYTLIKRMKMAFDEAMEKLKAAQQANNRKAIKRAEKELRKVSRVLILEDDSGFGFLNESEKTISLEGVGTHLRMSLQDLPDNWDMLYLVVCPLRRTFAISPFLCKIGLSWSLNAYAVSYRMYDAILEHLKRIEDPQVEQVETVDLAISRLHGRRNVYAIYPSVVFAHSGKSSITDKTWQPWQGQATRVTRKLPGQEEEVP